MSAPIDCPGCQQPIEGPGYDAGCSDGCTSTRCYEHVYCTRVCYETAAEGASDRAYEAFHAGDGR